MSFRTAVGRTPAVQARFRDGLQAVKSADRDRLRFRDTHCLRGSVDLDEALEDTHPNDPRWDYAIGLRSRNRRNETVLWLEIHPASSLHVGEVLNKLRWLKDWLANDAPALKAMPGLFRWVATGSIAFRRGSRQERQIAEQGLRFPSKQVDLDDLLKTN